jgi:hypothetical protein
MPTVDPTRALASAQDAFGNIGDSIRAQREAESLAAMNAEKMDLARREQDFSEGALDRALQEEETLFQRGRERNISKGQRLEDALGGVGGSRKDEILASMNMGELLKNEEAYQSMTPENKAVWEQDFAASLSGRQDLTSDVDTLRSNLTRTLMATGDYNTPDELEVAVNQGMERKLQQKLMDPEIISRMLPGASDGPGGQRASFYEKMALKAMEREGKGINESNFINSQEYKDEWFKNKDIEEERWSLFGISPLDIGQPKVYQKKVNRLVGEAAERGFSQGAVLGTLDEFVYDEHSPRNMDLDNLSTVPDPETGISQADDFWTKVADKQRQIGGGGGGDPLMAILAGAGGGTQSGLKTSDLLSGLDFQNASPEKIQKFALAEFRNRHGSAQVKKGEVNPRTGMVNPETTEEAVIQEALLNPGENPELADAIAAGPAEQGPGLAEALGGAARGTVNVAGSAADTVAGLNQAVYGNESWLAKALQGKSGTIEAFKRGFGGK